MSTGSAKKSVRFSEVVHRQVFRSNSSILGQRMKNIKKAEQKKRRALERRASEGDAEHLAGSWTATSKKSSQQTDDDNDDGDDSQTDSGLASSVEETSYLSRRLASGSASSSAKIKLAKQTKKKAPTGNFLREANPDLIFDLDF